MKQHSFSFVIFLVLLGGYTTSFSQSVNWLRQAGTAGSGYSVSKDAAGNIYVAGTVNDSAKFDHLAFGAHFADAFLAKYNSQGKIIWASTGGGKMTDIAYDLVTDANGNSYITGDYQTDPTSTTVEFGGKIMTGGGGNDGFVAMYDSSGNMRWFRDIKSKLGDGSRSITMDADGDVYICGYFSDTAIIGNDTLVSAGRTDIFVAKYDAFGNFIWARRAGGAGRDMANGITADANGDISVTGEFQSKCLFGKQVLAAAGSQDIFITKYDANGKVLWATRAGGNAVANGDHGTDIGSDAQGNLYITGSFAQTAYFDKLAVTSHPDSDYADIFIAKYDPTGNAVWVHHAGDRYNDEAYSIAVDSQGNSYITGFDGLAISPSGNEAVLVAKYNTAGAVQWVKGYAPGAGRGIYAAGNNVVYLTGVASVVSGATVFDTVALVYNDRNAFVAQITDIKIQTLPTGISSNISSFLINGSSTTTAVEESGENVSALVYPNPASANLYIQVEGQGLYDYYISDIKGAKALAGTLTTGNRNTLDIGYLSPGQYLLTVSDKAGHKTIYKVMKQ